MESSALLSNIISGVAVLLSFIALIVSQQSARHEQKRTLRSQLSDTLQRITDTQLENAKLFVEAANTNPIYYQTASATLNQQQGFLLSLASYLAEEIPELVTSVEYNTLAYSLAWSGDVLTAEKYYRKAIDVSPDAYYRSLATRSYASFLFPQRRFEEARDQYREALTLVKGGDDRARSTNGYTYQMWAVNELMIANAERRAEELFDSARNEIVGIENRGMQNQMLQGLQAAYENAHQQVGRPDAPPPRPASYPFTPSAPGPQDQMPGT
ncbi:MAG: hypothetical protein IT320_04095 [Anaerolineae bacterium]|nr:hypothetical protein [Anaerolineae bacterium]